MANLQRHLWLEQQRFHRYDSWLLPVLDCNHGRLDLHQVV
jgi:hypothetical protein